MTDEYSKEEIDQMVDDILNAGHGESDPPVRIGICKRCGQQFETTRPTAKLCQACRSAAKKANFKKGRAAMENEKKVENEKPEDLFPVTVTAGGLIRMIDSAVLEEAEITVDGKPIREITVSHVCDLIARTDLYNINLRT